MPGLARAAMPAAIMGDASVAVRGQEEYLVLEGVGAQRPAMAEDDRLTRTPVVVVDLRTVFRGDRTHGLLPSRGRVLALSAEHYQRSATCLPRNSRISPAISSPFV